jgi:hypothetical protein
MQPKTRKMYSTYQNSYTCLGCGDSKNMSKVRVLKKVYVRPKTYVHVFLGCLRGHAIVARVSSSRFVRLLTVVTINNMSSTDTVLSNVFSIPGADKLLKTNTPKHKTYLRHIRLKMNGWSLRQEVSKRPRVFLIIRTTTFLFCSVAFLSIPDLPRRTHTHTHQSTTQHNTTQHIILGYTISKKAFERGNE